MAKLVGIGVAALALGLGLGRASTGVVVVVVKRKLMTRGGEAHERAKCTQRHARH